MTSMMIQAEANEIQRESNQIQAAYNSAYANYLNTQLVETQRHNQSIESIQTEQNRLNDEYHRATNAINAQKNVIDERLGMLRLEFDRANESEKREIEKRANELTDDRNKLLASQISLDDFHKTEQEKIDQRRNEINAEYNAQQAVKWGYDYELGLRAQETAEAKQRSEEALNRAREAQIRVDTATTVLNAKIGVAKTRYEIGARERELRIAESANARAETDSIWNRVTSTINSVSNLARGVGSWGWFLKPMEAAGHVLSRQAAEKILFKD